MTAAGLFVDPADVLCDVLAPFGSTGRLTPPDLAVQLPFIRVTLVGGSDDRVTDSATVDVDVFHTSITTAMVLAAQVRQALIDQSPHVVGAAVLDACFTVARPRWLPYGTPNVTRVVATYRVTSRRQT